MRHLPPCLVAADPIAGLPRPAGGPRFPLTACRFSGQVPASRPRRTGAR